MEPVEIQQKGFKKKITMFVFLLFFLSVSLGFVGGYVGNNYDKFDFLKEDSSIDSVVLGASAPGILSFQGRITDLSETPITSSSNMTFRLYSVPTAGTALWTGACSVTPDQDGIFDIILGSTCGSAIPTSVFAENDAVYLGITVGTDSEMSPRQRIAASAYALNADTLKGFTPSQTPGIDEVVVLDSSGNLVFGVTDPVISATGNIKISPGSGAYVGIGTGLSSPAALLSVGDGSKFRVDTNGDITRIKDLVYSWPTAHPTTGQEGFLQSDDAGNLTWTELPDGSYVWGLDAVSFTEAQFLETSGIATLSNYGVDSGTEYRAWIHGASQKTGFSVYSNYSGANGWPVVSFKADASTFTGAILKLVQDGTGNIFEGYKGSDLVYKIDNKGDMHLSSNGIAYFEPFASAPTSGDLAPNSEGCIYSVGVYPTLDVYWDPACTGSAAMKLNTTSTSLWTDGGTFTYLSSTTDDLVLGATTTGSSKFFFDMSTGRLGIGTDTPQTSIDIAGASSEISNTDGDISILPDNTLIVNGGGNTSLHVIKNSSVAAGDVFGLKAEATQSVSGALTVFGNRVIANASHTSGTISGLQANSTQMGFYGSGGTTSYAEGLTSNANVSSGAIVSNLSMLRIYNPTNSGTISNLKGINIANMSAGSTSNYSIYSEGGTMYHAGDVGIGVNNPSRKLEVWSGSTGTETVAVELISGFATGGTTTTLRLTNSTVAGSAAGSVELKSLRDSSGGGTSFVISSSNSTPSIIERMRINSAGDVGIGTISPRAKLDIVSTSITGFDSDDYVDMIIEGQDTRLELADDEGGSNGPALILTISDGTNNKKWSMMQGTSTVENKLFFGYSTSITNGATYTNAMLTMTTVGNIGIGTRDPSQRFVVDGGSTILDKYLYMKDYDDGNTTAHIISRDSSINVRGGALAIGAYSNGAVPMTSSGQLAVQGTAYFANAVGIGTTSPTEELEIQGYFPTVRLKPTGGANNREARVDFWATFDNFPSDANTRRVAMIGGGFNGGTWGTEELLFRVGGSGDAASIPSPQMRVSANGSVYANASFVANAWDLAEYTKTSEQNLQPGDVVSFVSNSKERIEGTKGVEYVPAGVISTKPGLIMGNGPLEVSYNEMRERDSSWKLLALIGQVPVKVSLSPGEVINVNDYLDVSSIPRYAKKQTSAGLALGKAIETFNPSLLSCTPVSSASSINWPADEGHNESKPCYVLPDGTYVGKVMMFVNVSWYDPRISIPEYQEEKGDLLKRIEDLEMIYNAEEENYNIASILKLNQTESGDIEILGGKIIFEGNGTLSIRKLKVEDGYSAGSGLILGASTSVLVESKAVTKDSKIFVNPTSDTLDKQLYVTDIVEGESFKVNIREAIEGDITFDWFIVDSKKNPTLQ